MYVSLQEQQATHTAANNGHTAVLSALLSTTSKKTQEQMLPDNCQEQNQESFPNTDNIWKTCNKTLNTDTIVQHSSAGYFVGKAFTDAFLMFLITKLKYF